MQQMMIDFDQLPLIEEKPAGQFPYSEVFKAWKTENYKRYSWAFFRWALSEFSLESPKLSKEQFRIRSYNLRKYLEDLGGLASTW